jgi:protein involved in polysaccharide export with SLBB domain
MKSCRSLLPAILVAWSIGTAWAQQSGGAGGIQRTEALPGHVLSANDVIAVKVFDEPDLDTTARISEEGTISMPLINSVHIVGKTSEQAARAIRDKLAERFLVNPQVTVMVTEATKRLFTVMGQVQRPGAYRFPDRRSLNLIEAIGMAGSFTRLADQSRVTVKRFVNKQEIVLKFDAKKMAREETTKAVEIQPGDIIEVRERLF